MRRLVPSPSMAVAFLALLVAIGGTSYAVTLKTNSVSRAHLKNNAVTGAKVLNDSLTGADIKESTLEGLSSAGGIGGVEIKTSTGTVPAAVSLDQSGVAVGSAVCDEGQQAIAGGGRVEVPGSGEISDSFPDAGGTVWTVHAANGDTTSAHGFTVYAICVNKSGGR